MNEGQIVRGFLFPTRQQAASAVGPTVCTLDDPTAGALASAAWLGRLATLRAVQLVSATLGKSPHRFARVPFVQAEMLPAASAHLDDSWDTAAGMVPSAAKVSQEFAKTCPANRNASTHLRAKNEENTLPVLRTKYTVVQY